jgi:cytochrome b involved in lipid metabolism
MSTKLNTFFSMAEVSKHNRADDCWMVIHGKVYDVTEYVDIHPGLDRILEGAGKDATDLFESVFHSQSARMTLGDYFIGMLSQ